MLAVAVDDLVGERLAEPVAPQGGLQLAVAAVAGPVLLDLGEALLADARDLKQPLGLLVDDSERLYPEGLDHAAREGVAEAWDRGADEVALDAGDGARIFDHHALDLEAATEAGVV